MSSFLFIPDISGFSDFVQSTAIEHSNHIISELLELLIDNNTLDLELAEIEGDALFYYKFQSVPSLSELTDQVEIMFLKFYEHLSLYERQRICNCGACINTQYLKLKFVVHAGDFNFLKVKNHKKPFGDAVIEAHRLLKNSINHNEYLLISDQLNAIYKIDDPEYIDDFYNYDIGKIDYKYKILEPLKKNLVSISLPNSIGNATPLFDIEMKINQHITPLANLIIDFDKRDSWNTGAIVKDYKKDRVNRVNAKHVCIVGQQTLNFETITKPGEDNQIVYGERLKDVGFIADSLSNYFILTPIDEFTTHLKFESRADSKNIIQKMARPLLRFQMKKRVIENLNNLKMIAEGL